MQLGEEITKGLGAGADPSVGRRAAEENRERIYEIIEGADMLFITAGMGGGTGTGAAPIFAEIAKDLGILTVAVVTRPFSFEGRRRAQIAEQGIKALSQHVDSLITIPNDKLLSVLGKSITLLNAFKAANQVLQGAVQGIADLITCPGLINLDFADVRTVMLETGMAMMGSGSATGENRAKEAAEMAISSPLLEDIDLGGAHGVLVNISAGYDLAIGEFQAVGDIVKAFTSEDAVVVVGTVLDPDLGSELRVTLVVTGLGPLSAEKTTGEGEAGEMTMPMATSASVAAMATTEAAAAPPRFDPTKTASPDYSALETPTLLRRNASAYAEVRASHTRQQQQTQNTAQAPTQPNPETEIEIEIETEASPPIPTRTSTSPSAHPQTKHSYLDIPTFLRQRKKCHD